MLSARTLMDRQSILMMSAFTEFPQSDKRRLKRNFQKIEYRPAPDAKINKYTQ